MSISYATSAMLYEVLGQANDMVKQDREKAIEFLQKNRNKSVIEQYLKLNYDPEVKFFIPPGIAPYKKKDDVPDGYCQTDLRQEYRRMRIFTDANLQITKVRREQLWIQMCEGLYWKEADLINKIKDRRLTDMYAAFTADFVREVFPGLIPDAVAEPVPDEMLAPIEYGDDPSLIPEQELIKASVAEYLKEEEAEAKKSVAGAESASNPAPAAKSDGTQPVKERMKPGPKPKQPPPAPVKEPEVKERKKPGPKPKIKQEESVVKSSTTDKPLAP